MLCRAARYMSCVGFRPTTPGDPTIRAGGCSGFLHSLWAVLPSVEGISAVLLGPSRVLELRLGPSRVLELRLGRPSRLRLGLGMQVGLLVGLGLQVGLTRAGAGQGSGAEPGEPCLHKVQYHTL